MNELDIEQYITLAMSRYKERGYEIPRMNMIITARLSVRSHRNGCLDSDGNNAVITWGMLSPTMMQKATMPPKALQM